LRHRTAEIDRELFVHLRHAGETIDAQAGGDRYAALQTPGYDGVYFFTDERPTGEIVVQRLIQKVKLNERSQESAHGAERPETESQSEPDASAGAAIRKAVGHFTGRIKRLGNSELRRAVHPTDPDIEGRRIKQVGQDK